VGIWIFSWAPYGLVAVISQIIGTSFLTPVIAQAPSMLCKVASCLNPIIYAISHPKFREALSKEFPGLGIREESAVKSDGKTVSESA